MKPWLTLTLTASLIASSLPAAAQFPFPPAPRYAPPPRQQYPVPPAPPSTNWTRVRAIAPRSPIRVTAVGLGDQEHQYFVSATEHTLTLLTLGGLPRSAKRLALTLAGSHPELFQHPDQWAEFKDGKVRANPDGLFIGRRKIADLGDIAKTIDSGDVAEVLAEVTVQQPPGHDMDPEARGIAGLAFVGALYGTLAICKDKCGSAALLPILGAPIIAGILASRRSSHTMELIYRVR
jgi:hypothetical protein